MKSQVQLDGMLVQTNKGIHTDRTTPQYSMCCYRSQYANHSYPGMNRYFMCVIELIRGWIEVWKFIQALHQNYMYSISEHNPDVARGDYAYQQDTIYVTITNY